MNEVGQAEGGGMGWAMVTPAEGAPGPVSRPPWTAEENSSLR